MKLSGWIFLVLFWGTIIVMVVGTFSLILKKKS